MGLSIRLIMMLALSGFLPAAVRSEGEVLEVLRKIPHSGYSEGLDFHEGFLWHPLPKEIVKIDPKDGTVVARFKPASKYNESVTWFREKLWTVSYSDDGIYEGILQKDQLVFRRVGTTPEVHAWGITQDGTSLILTGNYSPKLYFVDPATLKVTRTLVTPMKDLEDLAWDGEGIWTSSFSTHKGTIFRIDPKTGMPGKLYRLPKPEECPIVDGLAYDGKQLFVTGKHCPSIYVVKRPVEERAITSKSDPKK